MASEEDERLAKIQQDKIDKEKFETELAEAGITVPSEEIGRASCRERVSSPV